MTMLFFAHAIADGMLMFRIPIPIGAGIAALARSFWGVYEMAVNEHSVNPETVRFNESLILGRQIINILAEGSAELNPERKSYCIDQSRTEVRLPITINSTNPILMEILRTDLDTQKNETIQISKSMIKTMHKDASRLISYSDKPNEPKTLYYPVKKPGLYVLSKVLDESNLEVSRRRLAHTVIVPCPKAKDPQGLCWWYLVSLHSQERVNLQVKVCLIPPDGVVVFQLRVVCHWFVFQEIGHSLGAGKLFR